MAQMIGEIAVLNHQLLQSKASIDDDAFQEYKKQALQVGQEVKGYLQQLRRRARSGGVSGGSKGEGSGVVEGGPRRRTR